MASSVEAKKDADADLVKQEGDDKLDKEKEGIGKSVNIEDKSIKRKTLSFTKQRLGSRSLFGNFFSGKNVSNVHIQ